MSTDTKDDLLTPAEVRRLLGCSKSTLKKWTSTAGAPLTHAMLVFPSGHRRFFPDQIDAFIRAHRGVNVRTGAA